MNKQSIIFDLDGTLTDSGEGITKSIKPVLDHYGIPCENLDDLRFCVGPPLRGSFLKLGVPEDCIEEAIAIYRSRYTTIGKFENTPYPGIYDLLARLKAEGHTLYVATSKPEQMSMDILNKFELTPYFDLLAGATLDGSRDHKADVIAYLLQQTGSDLEAIMVGDTVYDVVGAAAHGIPTVGVSWGYGSVTEMEAAGAYGIAHTMDELHDLLNR